MKRIVLFPVVILLFFSTFQLQAKQEKWHKGILYLNNNEVFKGNLSFDQKLNLVQIRTEDKIKVYSPVQVKLFQFYDSETESNRVFTSVAEIKTGNWLKKKFFEVVLTGNITVLRTHQHTAIEQVPVSIKDAPLLKTRQFRYVETIRHDYYILHKNKLEKLDNFTKDILPLTAYSKQDFKDYIAKNDLNIREIKDQIKFIDHLNKERKTTSISLL